MGAGAHRRRGYNLSPWSAPADLAEGSTCELLRVFPCGGSNPGVGDMQVGCAFAGERAFALSLDGDFRELLFGADDGDETMETRRDRETLLLSRTFKTRGVARGVVRARLRRRGSARSETAPGRSLGWSASGEATFAGDETGTGTEEEIPGDHRRDRARRFSFAAGLDDALHVASTNGDGDDDGDEDGDAFDAEGIALPAQPRDVDAGRTPTPPPGATRSPARRYSAGEEGSAYAVVGNVALEGGARAPPRWASRRTGTSSRSGARTVRFACSAGVAT